MEEYWTETQNTRAVRTVLHGQLSEVSNEVQSKF